MALSDDGTLVYLPGARPVPDRTLTWVGLDGKESPIPVPPGPYLPVDLSSDGRTLLVSKYDEFTAQWELWLMPLGSGEWRKPSSAHNVEAAGVFSEDGKAILFSRMGTGLIRQPVEPIANEQVIAPEPDYSRYPVPVLPGQKEMLFVEGYHPGIMSVVYAWPLDPPATAARRVLTAHTVPRVSPDLRWVALRKDGRTVVIRPYPLSESGQSLVVGAGTAPLWSPDGRTLYYTDAKQNMVAVPFFAGASPKVGTPRVLFHAGAYELSTTWFPTYHLSKDGRAFLMAKKVDTGPAAAPSSIHVIRNWFADVQRLAHPLP